MTKPDTVTGTEELDRLRLAVVDLTRKLEVANLRTEVAVGVISLIDRVVEDHHGRSVVVADIVDCWLNLDPLIRQAYEGRGPGATPVGHFAADYTDEVTLAWEQSATDELEEYDTKAEQMDRLQWNIRIAKIQQRHILDDPPSDAWLARFTSPFERTS